jgi:hypothetical protein
MRSSIVLLACALSGCATLAPPATTTTPPPPPPAAPAAADLSPYLELLDEVAAADPQREAALLGELADQLVQAPGSRTTLRHALALGAAGHAASDPVEARRLLQALLAEPGALDPAERQLAGALLREYDARVTLYAQLARQREEAEGRLAAANEAHWKAMNAASADAARLRRELAQAERKLQAIAEMERELLEQVEPVEPVEARPPEQP